MGDDTRSQRLLGSDHLQRDRLGHLYILRLTTTWTTE
jgi:hypothetical protein